MRIALQGTWCQFFSFLMMMNDCLVKLVPARLVNFLIIVFLGFTIWGATLAILGCDLALFTFLSSHVILKWSQFENHWLKSTFHSEQESCHLKGGPSTPCFVFLFLLVTELLLGSLFFFLDSTDFLFIMLGLHLSSKPSIYLLVGALPSRALQNKFNSSSCFSCFS